MTIFGKTISGFANKFGNSIGKLDYGKIRHIAMDAGKFADKGLGILHSVGKTADSVLGTAQKYADMGRGIPVIGTAASLVGGGLAQARNVVRLGNRGVEGLEKVVKEVKNVSNGVDRQVNPMTKRLGN